MEKRKFKVLLCLFLATAVMFAGCSLDDDDDDTPPANSVSIPKYSSGKILKNKVLRLKRAVIAMNLSTVLILR